MTLAGLFVRPPLVEGDDRQEAIFIDLDFHDHMARLDDAKLFNGVSDAT